MKGEARQRSLGGAISPPERIRLVVTALPHLLCSTRSILARTYSLGMTCEFEPDPPTQSRDTNLVPFSTLAHLNRSRRLSTTSQ